MDLSNAVPVQEGLPRYDRDIGGVGRLRLNLS